MKNQNKSISQIIYENIVNGKLRPGFSLADKNDKKAFIDGAIDGMALYHVKPAEITDEVKEYVKEALFAAANDNADRANELFKALGETTMMINLIGTIQKTIIDNKEQLNPGKIITYAINTLSGSTEKDCVKAALIILSVIKQNDNIKYLVNVAAVCDEFTFFAIHSIAHWDNANQEIMDLGKRVSGWGKIHAVRFVNPETEEIKDWLLEDGINNRINPAYSAYTVYSKSGIPDRLNKKRLRYPEFHNILKVCDTMLEEGPLKNISMVNDREQMFVKLYKHAESLLPLENEDYIRLAHITAWLKGRGEDTDELDVLADKISNYMK